MPRGGPKPAQAGARGGRGGRGRGAMVHGGPTTVTHSLAASDPEVPEIKHPANEKYYELLGEAERKIRDCPIFSDVPTSAPIPIDGRLGEDTGVQCVFELRAFKIAMAARGEYRAAQNIFAVNFRSMPSKMVPLRLSKTDRIRAQFMSTPSRSIPWDFCLTVAVNADENPEATFGSQMMLRPPEFPHALIFQVAEDIDQGMSDDQLKIWRVCMLTFPFCYRAVDNFQSRYWTSLQLREDTASMGDFAKRTDLERGADVMEAKAIEEKIVDAPWVLQSVQTAGKQMSLLVARVNQSRSLLSMLCSQSGPG